MKMQRIALWVVLFFLVSSIRFESPAYGQDPLLDPPPSTTTTTGTGTSPDPSTTTGSTTTTSTGTTTPAPLGSDWEEHRHLFPGFNSYDEYAAWYTLQMAPIVQGENGRYYASPSVFSDRILQDFLLVASYPMQSAQGGLLGVGDGGVMILNQVTFEAIDPLDDYVSTMVETEGGAYYYANMSAAIGIAAAQAALPCNSHLARFAEVCEYTAAVDEGYAAIRQGDLLGVADAALALAPGMVRQCFTADTQVITGFGESDATGSVQYETKAIQDLKPGQTVLAFDPQTGAVRQQKILQTFVRQARTLRILEIADHSGELQTIETTNEHPFWLPELKKFVKAKELQQGDRLYCPSGELAVVASVKEISPAGGVKVYNFEVGHDHTYFVRAHGTRGPPVGVHNADGYDELLYGAGRAMIPATGPPRTTVIGRMDDLLPFSMAPDVYDTWRLSGRIPGAGDLDVRWPENLLWLQDRIARGDSFAIATDPATLPNVVGGFTAGQANGYFTARELLYLTERGIDVIPLY